MNPLPLFDTPLARRSDPATSHAAAVSAVALAHADRTRILAHLNAIWPGAATYRDIADATGLERHAVGRRLSELRRAGMIVDAGERRMDSGRMGQLWAVVK